MQSPTHLSASSVPPSSKEAKLSHAAQSVPLNRYVIFWALAVGGCLVDLLTKHWVFQWRGMPRANNEWWLWENYIGIETALNTGALFGLGKDMVAWFAVLSVIAGVGIVYWLFAARAAHDLHLTIALGCVMGGILGNLYDRLGLWDGRGPDGQRLHAVRDWILLRYGEYTWPNFNIADSLLVCGAGLLVWHAIRHGDGHAQHRSGDPAGD